MTACLYIRGWRASPGYRWRLAWKLEDGGPHQDIACGLPGYQMPVGPTRIQMAACLDTKGWWTSPEYCWLLAQILGAGGPHQDTAGCLPGY
jgi:hypothetical protein